MIQFNLLPDIKLQYVKTNRLKHTISVIAVLAAAVSLFIMLLLFLTVDVVQKQHLSSLASTISSDTNQIKDTPNINQILTVQDEMNALPTLHGSKPVASRLPGFLSEVTPTSATISNFSIDLQANTISLSGSADSLTTVNKFVDTLKGSTYQTSSNSTATVAFSNVVLTSFGYATLSGATYTISASFDPNLFSGNFDTVTLNVPNQNGSRQYTNLPLFNSTTPTTTTTTTTTPNTGTTQ